MELSKSKVYVKTDDQNRIIRCDGGYTISNIQNFDEWIYLDEGCGDRYNLCQSNYFDRLYTQDGIPRYKLVDGEPVLRSDEEIEADKVEVPAATTLEEKVDALIAQNETLAQQNEMLTECLLEISEMVYAG